MTNGNIKTILTRRSYQWDEFLGKIIEQIEANGYPKKIWKPEIERLILKHSEIKQIEKDIIDGFQGIDKIRVEVEQWMKGK